MCVWRRVSNPNALNVWNTGYISLTLIQFIDIVKEENAAAEPGPSTQQEGNNVVVSEGVSRNKSTGKQRGLSWRSGVAKGIVSMAEGPAEHQLSTNW